MELLYDEMVVCLAKQEGHHAAAAVGASSVHHGDSMMAAILNNSGTLKSSATVFICTWGRYECALVGCRLFAALPSSR